MRGIETPVLPSSDPQIAPHHFHFIHHFKILNGILHCFNTAALRVDVSGTHAFTPPNFSKGDMRGPCPGLNALANHNYLPHSEFAIIDYLDLELFLSVYGIVMDGNPLFLTPGWSICRPPSNPSEQNLLRKLLSLVSALQSISGSHNKYETDTSPTRAATANYNIEVLPKERNINFERLITKNPYIFYGSLTGMAVSQTAHTFIYRFISNETTENSDGVLKQEVVKGFFAISEESGNFTYSSGNKRNPENWYKPAIGDDVSHYPNILTIGGNTGTVNTSTPVGFEDPTGGAASLAAPDLLKNLYKDITKLLAMLNKATKNVLAPLRCPQLSKMDAGQLGNYPGYAAQF
ncbi:Chloroperoxidase [Rhexocercosporidium sp. MPI-PUGE-AT-0058]|nr:Chloroperoxidase [Rhexocercosporidium sp. MPI-PUGE-AT-0058]